MKSTYMNIVLNIFADFQRILRYYKNINREEIEDLCKTSFTGRYPGLISYMKTVLES